MAVACAFADWGNGLSRVRIGPPGFAPAMVWTTQRCALKGTLRWGMVVRDTRSGTAAELAEPRFHLLVLILQALDRTIERIISLAQRVVRLTPVNWRG